MLNELVLWLQTVIAGTYTYSRGMWVDSPAAANLSIVAVMSTGGLPPDVDDRRQRFRVIILGPRNGRAQVVSIEQAINALALAALGDSTPCGAAAVRATGEVVGPGYTNEDRPWYSLDLEVVF